MNMHAARSKRGSYHHEPYLVFANSLMHSQYIESFLLRFSALFLGGQNKCQTLLLNVA